MRSPRALLASLALLLTACSNGAPPQDSRLEVAVAALTLPGVQDVCYSLTIRNEANQPVSSRSDICASKFGASGGITYVATCDATDNDGNGTATNSVTLTIDGLYGGPDKTAPITDYIDPCAAPHAPDGCQLTANCVENGDTAVTFNLTLMRQANQGFFDIAVNFDDIFCAAKLDCTDSASAPLKLLHNPTTGLRDQTAVVALACTTGPGGADTHLLRDPIKVTCDSGTTYLDPTATKGNAYGSGFGQVADPNPADRIWQYAIYAGSENLTCGGVECDKRYWNIAVGFDPTAKNCRLTTAASAIDASVTSTFSTPAQTNYPLIAWDVALTSNTNPATLACSKHPLNGTPTGVATTYTGVGKDKTFVGLFTGSSLEVGPCPTGYSGRTCSNPVCSPTCGTHGTCTGPNTCTCDTGYGGATCDTPVCTGGCGANASCTGPETCTCNSGYFLSGGLCQLPTCTGGCANGGTCTAPNTCACATGWTGANCQNPICTSACQNGGTCTAPDTCSCPSGWTGPTCGTPTAANLQSLGLEVNLDAGVAISYPGTGTTWTDLAGANDSAILVNGPTFTAEHQGSVGMTSGNDYVDFGKPLLSKTGDWTLSTWVRFNTLTVNGVIFGQYIAMQNNGRILIRLSEGSANRFSLFLGSGSGYANVFADTTTTIVPNVWYNLAVSRNANTFRLYINGRLDTTTTVTTTPQLLQVPAILGGRTNSAGSVYPIEADPFDGRMATFATYSRALSDSEVLQNFEALVPRFFGRGQTGVSTSGLVVNLDAGQVASYPGTGLTWTDLSGSGNHATLNTAVKFGMASEGALVMDGSSAKASVPGTFSGTDNGDFTVTTWFRMPSSNSTYRGLLSKRTSSNYRGWTLYLTPGNGLGVQLANAHAGPYYTAASSAALTLGKLYQATFVYKKGQDVTLYLDGVLNRQTSIPDLGSIQNPVSLDIGAETGISNFNGTIHQVQIYDRALSASDVASNYQGTRLRYDTLVAYDFAFKSSFFPTTTTTVVDLTGQGNHGTLLNGPTYGAAGGGSLTFDGADDRVSIPGTLGNGVSQLSVSVWFNPSSLPSGYYTMANLIGADDNSSADNESVFSLHLQSFSSATSLPSSLLGKQVVFGVRSSSQASRNRPIVIADSSAWSEYLQGQAIAVNPVGLVTNRWIHLAGVYTGSETLLYINGALVATSASQPDGVNRSVSGVLNTSTIERTLGAATGYPSFAGKMRHARIYAAALTASQVQAEFNALDAVLNPP